jgi:hypothetical protein
MNMKIKFWPILIAVLGILTFVWSDSPGRIGPDKKDNNISSVFSAPHANKSLLDRLSKMVKAKKLTYPAYGFGAISGRVTQAQGGAGIQGIEVTADQLACPAHSASTESDENGNYIIEGLPAGEYEVHTENSSPLVDLYWNDRLSSEEADMVEVIADDTTENIDFSLRAGGRITGVVTFSEATFVIASVHAIHSTYGYEYTASAIDMSDNSASYAIEGLPAGTYRVKSANMFEWVDEYYDDKPSQASADLVPVTEDSTTRPINFTLNIGGSIEGIVVSSTKGPLEGIPVWGYFSSNPEWVKQSVTDNVGSYTISGLRSGYWKILAWGDTTYAFEWYDNKNGWDSSDSVYIISHTTFSGKNFSLEIGGSISGYVYTPDKGLLAGCEVTAYESSSYPYVMSMKFDTTKGDGNYKIRGLHTGDYYMVALGECAIRWYDNKPLPEQADLVHVNMPDETSGINFNVPSDVENTADNLSSLPLEFGLSQNHPNPFNPVTEIDYTLKKPARVTLQIYNVRGQQVKTLVNEYQSTGFYGIVWDGKNAEGKKVASGIYFYRLEVNGASQTKRMVLLK